MIARRLGLVLVGVLLTCFGAVAGAEVQLPSVIGDNMVLQRGTDAPVWGWDAAGTAVSVSFRGQEAKATAGADGKWMARVPTGEAGGPFELTVKGSNEVTVKNVMVGEVWVAGGQSNMWFAVSGCTNAQEEMKNANYPGIRFYDANTGPAEAGWRASTPQRTVQAVWQVATPETVGSWAGTAYFFARDLHKELGVPVGIVHLAVPGSEIEPWLSRDLFDVNFPEIVQLWDARRKLLPEATKDYEQALAGWQKASEEAKTAGKQPPQKPQPPANPDTAAVPGSFFNGMVWPCAPFAAKGFIWWQGESNSSRPLEYTILFPALIQEWRHLWGSNDAPFLFVELANFLGPQSGPVEDAPWPALRDAQHAALRLSNVYMACTIDIMPVQDAGNIHPPNKQLAGHRLFLAAMANVYGKKDLVWCGPLFRSAAFDGGKAVVSFDHVGGGLTAKGGGELKGFALAGSDRKFYWADATIQGDTVVLTSKGVPQPVAVRYDWANDPIGNLGNAEGLPCAPFRSDQWLLMMGGKF